MVESRVLHGRLQKGRKPARSALVTLLVVAGAFAAVVENASRPFACGSERCGGLRGVTPHIRLGLMSSPPAVMALFGVADRGRADAVTRSSTVCMPVECGLVARLEDLMKDEAPESDG